MKNTSLNDACSNLTRYHELQKNMELHEKRIQNVQPTLKANRSPTNRSCGHVKKQPLAEFNRIMTIDIENKALLKKLTDKSSSHIGKEQPYKLIKNNRRKNLEEYKQKLENEGLLKRIKQAKSSYQNAKFSTQRKITESYINTISKFGYKDYQPNKTIMFPLQQRNPLKCRKNGEHSVEVSQLKAEERAADGSVTPKETIQGIETKRWSGSKSAAITYVIWQQKVTIQIDVAGEDSMGLEIDRSLFRQHFGEKVRNLHRSVKYDESSQEFYIDFPTSAAP